MSTTSLLEEMGGVLEEAKADAAKWDARGVDAAGMRLRKALLNLSKMAKEGRDDIQKVRNTKKNGK